MRPIDADALLEQIETERERLAKLGMLGAEHIVTHYVRNFIEDAPTIDRAQGEWKRRLVDNGFNADWVCSECGYRVKTDFVSFNYCPNCGARMKGADDEL